MKYVDYAFSILERIHYDYKDIICIEFKINPLKHPLKTPSILYIKKLEQLIWNEMRQNSLIKEGFQPASIVAEIADFWPNVGAQRGVGAASGMLHEMIEVAKKYEAEALVLHTIYNEMKEFLDEHHFTALNDKTETLVYYYLSLIDQNI